MNKRVAISAGKPEEAKRYARALEAVGLLPVVIHPAEEQSLRNAEVAGLLISGGTDVDPALYRQERVPESDEPDLARDAMERRLLEEALQNDIPVLGICRGLQLINVTLQGTLQQHHGYQETHRVRTPEDPSTPAHDVFVRPGTRLSGILGPGPCSVNSRHHQAIDVVSPELIVSAFAEDGIVEAVERDGRNFVVAVQWHPEDQSEKDDRQRKLFEAFGKAVTEGASGSAR